MDYSKIGARLKLLREKRGLSHEQIFEITRIQPSILKGIEEGNSSVAPVFLRGFVKTYIRFLGLDPNLLLKEELQEEKLTKKPKKTWGVEREVKKTTDDDKSKKPFELKYIFFILFACLIAVFLIWKNLSGGKGEEFLYSTSSSEENILKSKKDMEKAHQIGMERRATEDQTAGDQIRATEEEIRAKRGVIDGTTTEDQTKDQTKDQTGSQTGSQTEEATERVTTEDQTGEEEALPSLEPTSTAMDQKRDEISSTGQQLRAREEAKSRESSSDSELGPLSPPQQAGESKASPSSSTVKKSQKVQQKIKPLKELTPTHQLERNQDQRGELFSAIRAGAFKQEVLLKSSSSLLIYFKVDGHSTATKTLEPEVWFSIKAREKVYLRFDENFDENQGEVQIFHNGRRISITGNSSFFERTFSTL